MCNVNSKESITLQTSQFPIWTETIPSASICCECLKPHDSEMVPQRWLLRHNVVGVTPDRSWVPLGSPTASPVTAVRTSPRLRSNVPQPFSSFQMSLWRRKRPPGINISHLCALTQMSLRGNWLLFLS